MYPLLNVFQAREKWKRKTGEKLMCVSQWGVGCWGRGLGIRFRRKGNDGFFVLISLFEKKMK